MQITTNSITHVFGKGGFTEFTALQDVSISFTQGEFVTIIGATGSGKTTFIEHLNALLKPTKGSVNIDNQIINNKNKKIKEIKKIRKKVGIVFQFAEYQLFEETVLKDITFGPLTMGMNKKNAIENARKNIKIVGMQESYLERSPFELSGGQKRRVALAGILSMEPDFLILDEPTAGLDPEGTKQMYKIFRKLNKAGKTIVIVTHNLNHALEYSRRTILFKEGKVVFDGSSLDVLYNHKLLLENNLELPKIVSIVTDLEQRGKKIGRVRSINELSRIIKRSE